MTLTPLEYLLQNYPGDGSYDHTLKIRGHLSSCGISSGSINRATGMTESDLQNTPTAALSGGQRSRLALAVVSYTKPHVLFLDEPTNNLDLESVTALATAVKEFKGAVVVVSHDQYFVNEVANEVLVVNNGSVKREESFEKYRTKQMKKLV